MTDILKRSALALTLFIGLAVPVAIRAEKVVLAEKHTTVEKTSENEAERPLLDFKLAEAVWIIIIFSVLLVILYKTAWKNVIAGLKAREDRIRNDIADAESARAKSEASLKEYNTQLATAEQKVRDLLQAATVEAERISTQIKTQAQVEVEAARDRAAKDIETAKRQAIQDIYVQAATLSTSLAEKILRRNLNADDQRDLVSRSLEQLQGVN